MATLLLVDDDEPTRLICRRFFRRESPHVDVVDADTGESGLDVLRARHVDCILSDYRMGAMTGIDLLEAALHLRPHARRVLMSGFADPAIETAARRRAQVHAFIEKPVLTPAFEAVLRQHVLPLLLPA